MRAEENVIASKIFLSLFFFTLINYYYRSRPIIAHFTAVLENSKRSEYSDSQILGRSIVLDP